MREVKPLDQNHRSESSLAAVKKKRAYSQSSPVIFLRVSSGFHFDVITAAAMAGQSVQQFCIDE